MKKIIKHILLSTLTLLLGVTGSLTTKAQTQLDSVYQILNDDTVWLYQHPYVYSFVQNQGAAYTTALPFGCVEQQYYTTDSINYVLFDTNATTSCIDSAKQFIEQNNNYRGEFEVLTFNKPPYTHHGFIRTRNTLEIVFKDSNLTLQALQDFADDYNLKITHIPSSTLPGNRHVHLFQTLGNENIAFESAIDKAIAIYDNTKQSLEVDVVHVDFGILNPHNAPNDTLYPYQWAFNNTGSNSTCYGTLGKENADANIAEAQNRDNSFGYGASYSGNGIDIAVIDFHNFHWTHQDLNGQFKEGYNAPRKDTIKGFLNAINSFVEAHGTWVAGIIGAKANNNVGGSGVAYGCKMRPMLLEASSFDSQLATLLQKSLDWNVDIINMSIGRPVPSKNIAKGFASYEEVKACYKDGRKKKGIVMIASVGNEGNSFPVYPACFDEVLSIGASTPLDQIKVKGDGFIAPRDWGSNTPDYLDVVAPGVCIWGTDWMGQHGYNPSPTFHYFQGDGTSAAAPIVSGLAALLLERDSTLKQYQVYDAIRNGTDQIGGYNYNADAKRPGWSKEAGYGRVNGYKIVHQTPLNVHWEINAVQAWVNNPVQEQLTIHFVEMGHYQLQLYDGTGRLVQTTQTESNKIVQWSMRQLQAGSYVLLITDQEQRQTRFKIIKQ